MLAGLAIVILLVFAGLKSLAMLTVALAAAVVSLAAARPHPDPSPGTASTGSSDMAKNKKKKKKDTHDRHYAEVQVVSPAEDREGEAGLQPKMKRRIDDPRKIWKLSPMDLRSYSRWYDYSRARDAMFAATDTAWAPWYIADADDKKRARLNVISHLLSQVPYKPLAHRDITLPRRQPSGGYVQPDLAFRHIPTPF